jgi:hypothetical protein
MCVSASLRTLQPAMKTAPMWQDAPNRPKSHFSTTCTHNRDLLSQIFFGGCKYFMYFSHSDTSATPRHIPNPAQLPHNQVGCGFCSVEILDFGMFEKGNGCSPTREPPFEKRKWPFYFWSVVQASWCYSHSQTLRIEIGIHLNQSRRVKYAQQGGLVSCVIKACARSKLRFFPITCFHEAV